MHESVKQPNLSELIEAIGYFQVLRREKGVWKATAWIPIEGRRKWFKGIGATPEEAVVNLSSALDQARKLSTPLA